MRIPSFKRLFKNDFKEEYQALVEQLAVSINDGFDTLYNALNRGLTIRDNMTATVKDVDVVVDSNGLPSSKTSVPLDFTTKVDGVIVIMASNLTNPNSYPDAVFISFTQQDKTIVLNKITGLTAGSKYRIRLVAFGT